MKNIFFINRKGLFCKMRMGLIMSVLLLGSIFKPQGVQAQEQTIGVPTVSWNSEERRIEFVMTVFNFGGALVIGGYGDFTLTIDGTTIVNATYIGIGGNYYVDYNINTNSTKGNVEHNGVYLNNNSYRYNTSLSVNINRARMTVYYYPDDSHAGRNVSWQFNVTRKLPFMNMPPYIPPDPSPSSGNITCTNPLGMVNLTNARYNTEEGNFNYGFSHSSYTGGVMNMQVLKDGAMEYNEVVTPRPSFENQYHIPSTPSSWLQEGRTYRLRYHSPPTGSQRMTYERFSNEEYLAPIYLPVNPKLEYSNNGRLAVFWDVLSGTQWADAGGVRINISGAFEGTYSTSYTAGTNGFVIAIPQNYQPGGTITATLFREPFTERSTTASIAPVYLPDNPKLAYNSNGKITAFWDVRSGTEWTGAGGVRIELSGAGYTETFTAPYNAGTAGFELDIPEHYLLNRTFEATLFREPFTERSTTASIAPVFLPDNPRIEYGNDGKLTVFWDVILSGTQWADAGDVRIEMSGAFEEIYTAAYTDGTAGFEIDIPEELLSEIENPEFIATLYREPFTVRGTIASSTMHTVIQSVSEFNLTPAGNRDFTIDWEVDDGHAGDDWNYFVVVRQGANSHTSNPISVARTQNAAITLPDGFIFYEPLEIYLELYDVYDNLKRRNIISDEFVLVDLARYQIGAIPDYTVWHEGNVTLGFYMLTDTLQAENVLTAYVANPQPKGQIIFNEETGRFLYIPDKSDVRDFTVTFTAQSGSKTITQDVTFTMMATAKPQFTAFGVETNKSIPASGDEYMIVSESEPRDEPFNNIVRPVRNFNISGVEISSDSWISNDLQIRNLSGQEDIFELNIYAEKLIIRDSLHFPQTKLTIYAKELVFEGEGAINTSPVELQGRHNGIGAKGENAGDITLYIKHFKQSLPQTRFIQKGGKGQDTYGSGNTPGNGGNGGTFFSTIDLRAFSEQTGGGEGIQYLSDTSSDIIMREAQGWAGNFVPRYEEFKWLHPNWVSAVVKHGKDAYRNLHIGFSYEIFSDYWQEIEKYRKSDEWDDVVFHEQMELRNAKYEMQAVLYRISQNMDYFGNPVGWVPMLSFEVNKLAFENEIERAIRVMYLNHWLTNKVRIDEERIDGYKEALRLVKVEIEANIDFIKKLEGDISGFINDADILQRDIEDIIGRIERKSEELIAKAKNDEAKKKNFRTWSNIFAGAAAVVGVGITVSTAGIGAPLGGWLAATAIGAFALPTAFDVLYKSWSDNITIELNEDARNFLSSIDFASIANIDPSSITSTDYSAENLYYNISQSVSPMVEGVENLQKTFVRNSMNNEQLQRQLNDVASQTLEFQPFVYELERLNVRKEEFIRKLDDFINKITKATVEIQNGIATADGLHKSINSIRQKSDDGSDLRALQYLDDMNRRAEERLFEYHYYMAKSYEYRVLKPYTAELDLTGIRNKFIDISVTPNEILSSEQFKAVVLPVYEILLSDITLDILRDFQTGGKNELSVPVRFPLTQEELDVLNSGGEINLNVFERSPQLFMHNEENVRIANFSIFRIEVAPLEGSPSTASFDIRLEHSGLSKLRRDGQIYWFDHRTSQNQNPFFWRFRHDVINNITDDVVPSFASQSLLYSLLPAGRQGEIMLFSRPSAWSDIRVSKQDRTNTKMFIKELLFELQYDYVDRMDDRSSKFNVDVFTAEVGVRNNSQSASSIQRNDVSANAGVRRNWLTPYIEISSPDINDRSDGRGAIYRTYDSNKDVTFTAQEMYGRYQFVNWTDRLGAEVSTNLSLNRRLSGDMDLTANYQYTGAILSVADTIFIFSNGSSTTIRVENIGMDEMKWSAVSNNSWLQITAGSEGTDDGSFTLKYDTNLSGAIRIGTITIDSEDSETYETKTVYIVQSNVATTFTVTFDSQGGSEISPQTVEQGDKATQPAAPSRSGFTFGGWYKEATCVNAWNFDVETVNADVTLYAKWTESASTDIAEPFAPDLKIYPNPFKGEVRIVGAEGCTVQVFVATGVLVHTQMLISSDETIYLENLPSGVYFFRIEKDGKTQTRIVVKN